MYTIAAICICRATFMASFSGTRRKGKRNKYVSSSNTLRSLEFAELARLAVIPKYSGHGNQKSLAWQYCGKLVLKPEDTPLDEDFNYCSTCLTNEQDKKRWLQLF